MKNTFSPNNQHDDTIQALKLLVVSLKHKAIKTYNDLNNPVVKVFGVLIITALICLSLHRDNKIAFKEVIFTEKGKKAPQKAKKEGEKATRAVPKPNDLNTPTLFEKGIEVLPIGEGGNDLKPATKAEVDKVPPSVQQAFLDDNSNLAIAEMDRTGIPASITMAQAIVESRFGTSTLARKNMNHFGIKCFSKNCAEGHCSNHYDDNHKDFFRIYKSVEESFSDHSKFLIRNGYTKALLPYKKDYKAWANGLQKIGYATDQTYAAKLIEVIKRFELYNLDTL